jgi:transposase
MGLAGTMEAAMRFYCGLDLSARSCQVCVIDDNMSVQVQKKVRNDLQLIIDLIKPYKKKLACVVESTFNWYWLVDGLQEAGFDVCLAHTLGLSMITGAKVKTDPRDALALAKLLRAGMIPKAYIYPKESRPVRDLVRRRMRVVNMRATEYMSLRRHFYQQGTLEHSRNDIKLVLEEDIQELFQNPWMRLHASHELARIRLYTTQIREMERAVFQTVKESEEYKRLLGVTGIGKILAITIFYEIGEIKRFPNADKFSSSCRVIPGVAQSGTSVKRGRGSKQGNRYLKWAFCQAATYAVRSNEKIRRYYQRQLRRHRGKGEKLIANNIVAHKLAQAVFHMLRDGTNYTEEILFPN